jgi:hypothetical protein
MEVKLQSPIQKEMYTYIKDIMIILLNPVNSKGMYIVLSYKYRDDAAIWKLAWSDPIFG